MMKIKSKALLISKSLLLVLIFTVVLSVFHKSFVLAGASTTPGAPNPYASSDPGIPSDLAVSLDEYQNDGCLYKGAYNSPFIGVWLSPAGNPGVDSQTVTLAPGEHEELQINTMIYICGNGTIVPSHAQYVSNGVTYPNAGLDYPDGVQDASDTYTSTTYYFNSVCATSCSSITGFSAGSQAYIPYSGLTVYRFGNPVTFTYTAPSSVPASGEDTITANETSMNVFNNSTIECDVQVGNPLHVYTPEPQSDWPTLCGTTSPQFTIPIGEYNNTPSLTNTPGGGSIADPTTINRPTTSSTAASTITFAVGMNNNGTVAGPYTYLEFLNPNTSNYISPGISPSTTYTYLYDPPTYNGDQYNSGSYGYGTGTMWDGQGTGDHYYFGRSSDPAYGQTDWSVQYQGVQYQVAYRAPGGESCFQSAVTPSTPSIATSTDPNPPVNTLLTNTPDCFVIPPPTDHNPPKVVANPPSAGLGPNCNTATVNGTADDADWPTSNPGYSQAPLQVNYTIDGGPTESITTDSTDDSFKIPMNTYNGSAVDQLVAHTVSISVPDVNSIGDITTGVYAAATATVTYPPCYAPACNGDTLTVPGDTNGTQDGPSPGQTFITTAQIAFNPTTGGSGNSGSDEATGTYNPAYGNIYQDFQSLPSPQNGGNVTSFPYTWTNGVANPGVYTYDYGYSDGTATIGPCTSTVVIGWHPYVSVLGGDVLSGSGGYTTSSTPGQSCSRINQFSC